LFINWRGQARPVFSLIKPVGGWVMLWHYLPPPECAGLKIAIKKAGTRVGCQLTSSTKTVNSERFSRKSDGALLSKHSTRRIDRCQAFVVGAKFTHKKTTFSSIPEDKSGFENY
jgi:hypothetical protein